MWVPENGSVLKALSHMESCDLLTHMDSMWNRQDQFLFSCSLLLSLQHSSVGPGKLEQLHVPLTFLMLTLLLRKDTHEDLFSWTQRNPQGIFIYHHKWKPLTIHLGFLKKQYIAQAVIVALPASSWRATSSPGLHRSDLYLCLMLVLFVQLLAGYVLQHQESLGEP